MGIDSMSPPLVQSAVFGKVFPVFWARATREVSMPAAKRSDRAARKQTSEVSRWYRDRTFVSVLIVQLVVTLVAFIVAQLWSVETANAVLLGGGVCLGATLYSGYRVFGGQTDSPETALYGLYSAEVGKLVVAVALLAAVMATVEEVNLIALCLTYVGVQLSGNIVAAFTTPTTVR